MKSAKNMLIRVSGLLMGAVVCAMILSGAALSEDGVIDMPKEEDKELEDVYSDLETFANALSIIDTHYVEHTPPKELVYGSLKGMLSALDPYSQFLDPEAYKDIKVETEGKFGGIGVEITFRDGVLTVISPVDGTPADEAGVAPGDKVVRIDDKSTRRLNLEDAVKLLRGKPGSEVKITVLREEEGKVIDIKIKRAIINVKSIKEAKIIGGNIGYIRISEFQENTARDLAKSLADLEDQSIQGLILDLRNNPGGLLSVAIEVAEKFVPREQLIVYTKGRRADQDLRFVSEGISEPKPYPIVVLVNGGSASASEIVAGALKDHRLAVILGAQTFGKGSVQTVIPMRDGSAIRLTTSKYFTPLGRIIHGEGIEPDVKVPYKGIRTKPVKKDEGKDKVSEIFQKVKEMSGSQKTEEDELGSNEPVPEGDLDNQTSRAVDLIHALEVYGLHTFQNKTSR